MEKHQTSTKKKNDNNGFNVEGVIKADLGNYAEALKSFSKAIKSDPNNYVSYFNRGSIKMHFGDIKGARLDFIMCSKLSDKNSFYS